MVRQKAGPLSLGVVEQHFMGRDVLDRLHQAAKVQVIGELNGGVRRIPSSREEILILDPHLVQIPGRDHIGYAFVHLCVA
jgi:hypothetical protein